MAFDLESVRAQFPALSIRDNSVSRIYFDNPAGTQVPQTVIDAISQCLIESNANLHGPFLTSERADDIVDCAREAMADMLNASSPNEIIFGQNMTSLTLHMSRSIGRRLQPGDEVVLSRMDHDANVAPWLLLAEDLGLKIRWMPFNTETYEFDDDAIDKVLTDRTKLVCFGAASNYLGTINDVRAICDKARAAGAMTYIDAVQYVPHVATDVQALGCDFLVCSAYKFFGPHQGILWGRGDLLQSLQPYKARPAPETIPACFETGTQSHEAMAGTTAAVNYFAMIGESMAGDYLKRHANFDGRRQLVHAAMDCLLDYEIELATRLIAGLQQLPGVHVHGITDPEAMDRRVPTVIFTVDGMQPATIAEALAARNIFVWHGHNYAIEAASHINILDAGGAVRIGPVHYNGMDEIDTVLEVLSEILPAAAVA